MKKHRNLHLIAALFFFLVATACGCHIWKEEHQKEEEQQAFEQLEEQAVLPKPTTPPVLESTINGDQEITVHDAATLQTSNSDYIGWLSIPGTVISYPVMYSPSEPERYLHLDFYGRYSYSGTPFLDARCDPNDGNLIIYGHNMINSTMFGSLKNYRKDGYLDSHETVYLELADGMHVFEVFAVATLEKDDPWYSFLHAADADEEAVWIADLERKGGIHTRSTPISTKRLLTLSTCTGARRSERLILVAKEV